MWRWGGRWGIALIKISHKEEYCLELVKGEVTNSFCYSPTLSSNVLPLSSSQVRRQCSFQTTTCLTSSLECLSIECFLINIWLKMNISKSINHIYFLNNNNNKNPKNAIKCYTQNFFFGLKKKKKVQANLPTPLWNHKKPIKAIRTAIALHL